MSELKKDIVVASFAAAIGGAATFFIQSYFHQAEIRAAKEEFSVGAQFDMLYDLYRDRETAYLALNSAILNARQNPDADTLAQLSNEIFSLPILVPRVPPNESIIELRDEMLFMIQSIDAGNPEEILSFLNEDMEDYVCYLE